MNPSTPSTPDLPFDAILFASFGGPEKQQDVVPFLRNVTRGRGIPDERLEVVGEHYRRLGGRSPINDQNRRMIARLEAELARRGIELPVYWGNRNWAPYTTDVVGRMYREGHRRVLAVATSAYSSYSSCRQYREDFAKALVAGGIVGDMEIEKIPPYFDRPGFLEPVADGVREALASFARAGHGARRTRVLFSTHSIPHSMSAASGPAATPPALPAADEVGGWYVAQHLAACRWVMGRLGDQEAAGAEPPDWELVFQSRSGPPHIPWLEPDINDRLREIREQDLADAVVVVPIGFVTDHVEVVWDLDTEARETADELGLAFERVATSGTDPRFITALGDLVAEQLNGSQPRAAVTDLGAVGGLCGKDCCMLGTANAHPVPGEEPLDTVEHIARAMLEDPTVMAQIEAEQQAHHASEVTA